LNLLAEHDYEPVPGLPATLPEGEFIVWQGRPDWGDLAISAFQVRKIAVYFVVLLALRLTFQWQGGGFEAAALGSTAALAVLALAALGLLVLLAWLMARASLYTMTNRRVVIRCGVTVPVTVNLPFNLIRSADLRLRRNGHGEIALSLEPGSRASWIMLWPHVRSWSLGGIQPALRSLPEAEKAATVLAAALQEAAGPTAAKAPRIARQADRGAARAGSTGVEAHA
jgi:hypothetical protein